MVERCFVTTGLLDALLAVASERDPDLVSTLLLVSEAGDLNDADHDDTARETTPANATTAEMTAEEPGPTETAREGTPPAETAQEETRPAKTAAAKTTPDETVAVGDLDPTTPVFTDLYFPSAGRSVDAVFGMDVSVPHGQAQGRFVSHPLGELTVSKTDDLHEVVLVAVPPWTREDVAAFDRSGRRLELEIVAAAPPERPFEG